MKTKQLLDENKIILAKSTFLLTRLLSYFAFLFIPIWLPKLIKLNNSLDIAVLVCYFIFILSQFYLLSKEIDYRLKIHVKTNSSLDRILYRLISGQTLIILYFALLALLPASFIKHFFWGTWALLGLYYSWPTRGKIIQESISTDFNEFKFLDGFEKTTLYLILLTFFVSIPAVPHFDTLEVLKLYLDPNQQMHQILWNYVAIISLPFSRYPSLYFLAHNLYLYLISGLFFLLSFYALARYFFSRRLALLGVFSLVSSWSFVKISPNSPIPLCISSIGITWVWLLFWSIRTANYRSGLILGFFNISATMWCSFFYWLYWMQLIFIHFFCADRLTLWFKKQLYRYTLVGGLISTFIFLSHQNVDFHVEFSHLTIHLNILMDLLGAKSFYLVAPLGLMIMVYIALEKKQTHALYHFLFNQFKWHDLSILLLIPILLSLVTQPLIASNYFIMAILVFLSLIPLELIFQKIHEIKSARNIIYLCYFIFCLLDSHMESRFKQILTLMSSHS
jgi:hypothetical protein